MSVQLTAFIGREAEMAQARRLAGRSRLLTLTGPGGSGKTRLATELAADLGRERGEVWFCDLTTATDPSRLGAGRARVDRVLNAMEQPGSLTLEVSAFLHYLAGNYRGALQDVRESAALVSAFHVRAIWILGIGAAAAAELGEAGRREPTSSAPRSWAAAGIS